MGNQEQKSLIGKTEKAKIIKDSVKERATKFFKKTERH